LFGIALLLPGGKVLASKLDGMWAFWLLGFLPEEGHCHHYSKMVEHRVQLLAIQIQASTKQGANTNEVVWYLKQ